MLLVYPLNHPLLVGYDSNSCLCSLAQDPGRSGPAVRRRRDHSLVTPMVLGGVLWIYPRGDPPVVALTVHTTLLAIVTLQVKVLQVGVTPRTRSTQLLHVILAC